MVEKLTAEGYEQTKEKVDRLLERLAYTESRTDFPPDRIESACRSYRMIIREMKREIAVYEAKQKREQKKQLLAT